VTLVAADPLDLASNDPYLWDRRAYKTCDRNPVVTAMEVTKECSIKAAVTENQTDMTILPT